MIIKKVLKIAGLFIFLGFVYLSLSIYYDYEYENKQGVFIKYTESQEQELLRDVRGFKGRHRMQLFLNLLNHNKIIVLNDINDIQNLSSTQLKENILLFTNNHKQNDARYGFDYFYVNLYMKILQSKSFKDNNPTMTKKISKTIHSVKVAYYEYLNNILHSEYNNKTLLDLKHIVSFNSKLNKDDFAYNIFQFFFRDNKVDKRLEEIYAHEKKLLVGNKKLISQYQLDNYKILPKDINNLCFIEMPDNITLDSTIVGEITFTFTKYKHLVIEC